jgi:oligopeptidase A
LDEQAVNWDNFVEYLNNAVEALSRVWGVVTHLHHVVDNEQWRAAYNEFLPQVTEFWTELGQNERILAHYQTLAKEPMFSSLTPTRQRIVTNALRDFALSGALLQGAARAEYAQLASEAAQLQAKFSENVLDATNAYTYYARHDELVGMPEDNVIAMREAAAADGQDGYKITLHYPSYFPVLQYADDRALRERIYRANVTRASDLGEAGLDNTPIMQRLLDIRQREAHLLGYAHYADVSLASKMAQSVPQVTQFLLDLADKARPFAEQDMAQLRAFASTHLQLKDVQAWDVPYASEKLREQQYAFSEQEVKNYFPLQKSLAGLFRVIESLFKVQLVAQPNAQVWHKDVQYFEVKNINGQTIGGVYLDPYARPGKNSGAWMDEVRVRRQIGEAVQTPVAHMVCNFTAPLQNETDTYLYHDDLLTLFHESGHALHHLLTQVGDMDASGIRGVEWDAVELPSQFMENFCWDYEVLASMSAHAQTGEALPRALFDKMLAAKNFQSGMQMLRQVEFSLYDLRLHAEYVPEHKELIFSMMSDVRKRVSVVPVPEFNRFTHSFSHIFAGGYSAGYFSYKWAEVLSADVFAQFESAHAQGAPLLNPELGQKYWREILSVGGSRPAIDSFKAFVGREPQVDALLRHSGLSA